MGDNSAAFAKMQAAIDRIRALGVISEEIAPRAAQALREDTVKRIAAGVDPSGKPWQLTEAGKMPLRNAAKAVAASSHGSVALLILSGPEALHHSGKARGHVQRRILPGRASLESVAATLNRVAAEVFNGE